MLQEFGPEIWLVEGPILTGLAGFHFPTRMAVIRLSNGDLFLWSPVTHSSALQQALEALGQIRHLVAPSEYHHMGLSGWVEACPEAMVHAAPGLAEKRQDLHFESILSDQPFPPWADDVDQLVMENSLASEVVFFHRQSGTVLFTDLLQNYPKGWFSGWRAMVAKLDLMLEHEATVPRKFRLGFLKRRRTREALQRLLAWSPERVVMAHGDPVRTDGTAYLRRAFGWLGSTG